MAFGGGNVEGGGKIVADCVEKRLDASVPERGAAKYRHDLVVKRGPSQSPLYLILRYLVVFQVLDDQVVVGLRDLFHQGVPIVPELLDHLFGNRAFARHDRPFLVIEDGLLVHEVNHTPELVLFPNGYLYSHRIRVQPVRDRVNRPEKTCPHSVHLVDEANAGDVVLVCLSPYGFGLRLHSCYRVKDNNASV